MGLVNFTICHYFITMGVIAVVSVFVALIVFCGWIPFLPLCGKAECKSFDFSIIFRYVYFLRNFGSLFIYLCTHRKHNVQEMI